MLVPISNTPRDYGWGSTTLLADLEGRPGADLPEAEIWFGDHPGCPATVPDGRPLGAWLAVEGAGAGAPARLPYLLKLLAAASPLSIQAHPSIVEATLGFAREDAAGVPRDDARRTYRDENHKPELIVAISETFTALAGLRDIDATRRLVAQLGEAGAGLAERLSGADAAAALRGALAWVLADAPAEEIEAIIAAAVSRTDAGDHEAGEFAAEFALATRLVDAYPGDPGIVVAMLMNLVTIRRGEGIFVPAGVLHAYLEGLGVEIMAASDNVLRGGLTPKHIDVPELLRVLDSTSGPAPVVHADETAEGVFRYATDVPDFALTRIAVDAAADDDSAAVVPITGIAIVLATAGTVHLTAADGTSIVLTPGRAVVATPDERALRLTGSGEVFLAQPGGDRPASSAS